MNIYIFTLFEDKVPNSDDWLKQHQYNLLYYTSDHNANSLFSRRKPDVIITVSETCADFKTLWEMPLYIRRRWKHVENIEDITPGLIESYFTGALEGYLQPTITVFTSAFKSGHKIMRPYNTLRKQTNKEWEWIILDDSPEEDKDATWKKIKLLAREDCRIKVFKQAGNDGYIGSVKHITASIGRGLYVLEMDHDDELLPDALEQVINVFEKNPHVDMVASDCIEIYEDTLANHSYGDYFGYGRHGYYKQRYEGRWVNVARNGALDKYTLRHIVGIDNHLRAYRKSTYDAVRGHDSNLNVADDYELTLKMFLKGTIARIPRLLYVQYRNQGGNNFTFIRIDLIQKLVRMICNIYDKRIHDRLLELGLPDFEADGNGHYNNFIQPPNVFLSHLPDPTAELVLDPTPKHVSIIMPTFNRAELLERAVRSVLEQEFRDWVLYIIGDKCPTLEQTMTKRIMHDHRIRYWNLEHNRKEGGTYGRNYALKILASTDYIAYLDDDNYWYPDHLSTLYTALTSDETTSYAFSSFKSESYTIICKEPKRFRIDTSCLLHKRELLDKYGYWRPQSEVGYAHDFEFVSRWIEGGEPWVATELPTLYYQNSHQNMKAVYEAYPDQEPHQIVQQVQGIPLLPFNLPFLGNQFIQQMAQDAVPVTVQPKIVEVHEDEVLPQEDEVLPQEDEVLPQEDTLSPKQVIVSPTKNIADVMKGEDDNSTCYCEKGQKESKSKRRRNRKKLVKG